MTVNKETGDGGEQTRFVLAAALANSKQRGTFFFYIYPPSLFILTRQTMAPCLSVQQEVLLLDGRTDVTAAEPRQTTTTTQDQNPDGLVNVGAESRQSTCVANLQDALLNFCARNETGLCRTQRGNKRTPLSVLFWVFFYTDRAQLSGSPAALLCRIRLSCSFDRDTRVRARASASLLKTIRHHVTAIP